MKTLTSRLFALALVAALTAPAASAKSAPEITNADLSRNPYVQTAQIVTIVQDVFAGESQHVIDTTIRILMCESGTRHGTRATGVIIHVNADGSIRRGPDRKDIGAGQVRPSSHSAKWTKRLDATQIHDNVVYVYKLQQGRVAAGENRFADWYPSKSCWKQPPVTMQYVENISS